MRKRRLIPSALLFAACSGPSFTDGGTDSGVDSGFDAGADSGVDAGRDAGPNPCLTYDAGVVDAGVRCACTAQIDPLGTWDVNECCDPDVGNPCPICCDNPRYPDGGRQYDDAGTAVCHC
jgi:hypothetical protein